MNQTWEEQQVRVAEPSISGVALCSKLLDCIVILTSQV